MRWRPIWVAVTCIYRCERYALVSAAREQNLQKLESLLRWIAVSILQLRCM